MLAILVNEANTCGVEDEWLGISDGVIITQQIHRRESSFIPNCSISSVQQRPDMFFLPVLWGTFILLRVWYRYGNTEENTKITVLYDIVQGVYE